MLNSVNQVANEKCDNSSEELSHYPNAGKPGEHKLNIAARIAGFGLFAIDLHKVEAITPKVSTSLKISGHFP